MAYPASTRTLAAWVADVDQKASLLKSTAQQQKSLAAAGQLNTDHVRRFYDLLKSVHVFFTTASGVAGIAQYAKDEKGNQSLDPVAEFQAMQAEIADTITIINGFSANLIYTWPANNTTPSSPTTFTAGATVNYRNQLDALIATIG
jgi:hypothetical protein